MATLFVCVFYGAAEVAMGEPPQEFPIAIGATSTTGTLNSMPNRRHWRVRLFADADCFVTWGEDPTALQDGTSGRPLSAGVAEYFDIESGHKIAVIQRL